MPAITLHIRHRGRERAQRFRGTEVVLGRKGERLPDCDLAPDLKVSRPHARLYYDLSTWWAEDLGSRWGTLLNGESLTAPTPLHPGDVLRLGDTELRLEFALPAADTVLPEGAVDAAFAVEEARPSAHLAEGERVAILAHVQSLARKRSGQALLDALVAEMLRALPTAERGGIVLYQDRELVPVAFQPSVRAQVSFTLARRAVLRREAFRWERRSAANTSARASSLQETASALYAPIVLGRLARGVLYVDTTEVGARFADAELGVLAELATAIGRAIVTGAEDAAREFPAVFISYSHKDGEFVRGLARDLRREAIRVWFDERLRAGDDWREQLEAAVGAFDAFVLVLSPDSLSSEYVCWEVDLARGAGKPIIPLMYRTCELPEDLARVQYVDFRAEYEGGLAHLVEEIRLLEGHTPE